MNTPVSRSLQYREKLLRAGFSEARRKNRRFLRPEAEKTAFIVNLTEDEYGVSVVYGFTSTAASAMAGCGDWYTDNGEDNESCTLRNSLYVYDDASEAEAARVIAAFYGQYRSCTKDELLALRKEKQKVFLDRFARALKPLGFKKKGTTWTLDLGGGTALSFYAQKSAYSDQFYFNVDVHAASDRYRRFSCERVVMGGSDIYNWQLLTDEFAEKLVRYALTDYLLPKIGK